ncbi:YHYH domain-containing protein [Ureibacillus endophyticus]|uniref:YHYH domain-containing protein n=1 Tax=Ureibacillus endophyticus TaxID=1978490 RepID=A0A494Z347_9BACL|nr:YHYH domain-containing protein [Lysinibacillus endophyticus]RKQ16921.1 YHYH domain-containing protein [Lysinibacillus endophyticus]
MKKSRILLSTALIMVLSASSVYAHPGRTDSNGGHTCRTNCTERWGLEYGEYHYHNGGSSSSNSSSTSKSSNSSSSVKKSGQSAKEIATQKAKKAQQEKEAAVKKAKQIKQAEKDGYADGLKDGYNGISNIGISKYQGAYNKGYKEGFAKGKLKLTNEKNKAYRAGYSAAQNGKSSVVPSIYQTNKALSDSYLQGFERFVIDVEKQKYYQMGYNDSFNMEKYIKPDFDNANHIRWYKEGFDAGKKKQAA